MRKVKAALIQMNLKGDPASDSIETIRDNMIRAHMPLIEEAARRGVQVLGLQEVFNAPYFPATIDDRWFESAEAVPDGPTTQAMCEVAKTHGMVIVSPVYGARSQRHALQLRRGDRCGRQLPRQVPQDSHPQDRWLRRKALFRRRATSATRCSTPLWAEWGSISATTATSPRAGARSR